MAPALLRQVSGAGGFGTVLNRGSPWGASMLIIHRHGRLVRALERMPSLDGNSIWQTAAEGDEQVKTFVERQLRFDSDLWVIELDIDDPARFIPGLTPLA